MNVLDTSTKKKRKKNQEITRWKYLILVLDILIMEGLTPTGTSVDIWEARSIMPWHGQKLIKTALSLSLKTITKPLGKKI